MESILDIIQDIRNLSTINNNQVFIRKFSEDWRGVEFRKVAIYLKGYADEIELANIGSYTSHCIVISEKQYNAIFKPIFEQVGITNIKIQEIKDKLN